MTWTSLFSGMIAGAGRTSETALSATSEGLLAARMVVGDMPPAITLALGLVALAALAATVSARRDARFAMDLAYQRGLDMSELLRTVRMAEDIADLGVWQYDPNTGLQQWSDGMRRLFGINHGEGFLEGDAETLLFANHIDLVRFVTEHNHERGTYSMNFDLFGFEGMPRALSVQASNLRDDHGEVCRVVAVVRDATEQVEHLRELEFSRAIAVQEASRARELAATDPLTGLANRRSVMERLDRLVVDARRKHVPLTLLVFDIDHFKQVNDTYGHPEGDRVIQKVARIARMQAREGDIVGRVGGEEFVWLVPQANEAMVRIMAERLRLAIASESGLGEVPPVTVSIGYSVLQPGDSSLALFARADQALYEAKHAGRNRVRIAA